MASSHLGLSYITHLARMERRATGRALRRTTCHSDIKVKPSRRSNMMNTKQQERRRGLNAPGKILHTISELKISKEKLLSRRAGKSAVLEPIPSDSTIVPSASVWSETLIQHLLKTINCSCSVQCAEIFSICLELLRTTLLATAKRSCSEEC